MDGWMAVSLHYMEEFKKISHRRLRTSLFAESPPYRSSPDSDPYTAPVAAEDWSEYQRYLALVCSYDGYKRFPGRSAMELFGYFHRAFWDFPELEFPDDFDVL